MKKIYLACYDTGDYEDKDVIIVFASHNKRLVTKWVTKFNKIKKRWDEYYNQYCDFRYSILWVKDDCPEYIYKRWYKNRSIGKAYYKEIEIR